jgi:ornithine cyclodeaminase/alanine dehydrogenase-like protein (mu-crystallin family)
MRRVKYPAAPGERYVGLVLLFSTETCEPLIICPDGVMQRMRVGATNAIASKYLARKDAHSVAILGSGWQADAQLMALDAVHDLDDIRVYSPRKDRRLVFAQAMSAKLGKTVHACDTAEEACKGADVVNCSTNATTPVFFRELLEPGMHVGAIRPGASEVSRDAWSDIDVIALLDHDDAAELIYTHGVQVGEDREGGGYNMEHDDQHASWPSLPQIITSRREGRTDDGQITLFLNNLGLGYQFAAAGYVLYKKAKGSGLGNELPTDWFTELEHP